MKKTVKLLIMLSLLPISISPIFAAEEDPLINRRVLILDFINVSNSADYAYLEGSIPEAFMDPLSQTKSFELLLRTTWARYVTEARFNKEDAYREEVAIEAGKLAGADVVVIGQFVAMTDHIQIFAKAIEMSSGRIMVSESTAAPLDNDLFNAIEKLSNKMATEMKNKLPPLPQKVIIEQRIEYAKTSERSTKSMIRQAQTAAKAQKWRNMEHSQAERWRAMEQDQALKWRIHESLNFGWKEGEALIAQKYWAQPLFLRLLGNLTIGTLAGGFMGFGSSLGFTYNLDFSNVDDLITVSATSSTGALLGLTAGILVTLYDNAHLNESVLGPRLLTGTTLWWLFGGVVGSGIGVGVSYIIYQDFNLPTFLDSISIGSLTGLAIGLTFTLLPTFNIIPKDIAKNLIIDLNPLASHIGFGMRF